MLTGVQLKEQIIRESIALETKMIHFRFWVDPTALCFDLLSVLKLSIRRRNTQPMKNTVQKFGWVSGSTDKSVFSRHLYSCRYCSAVQGMMVCQVQSIEDWRMHKLTYNLCESRDRQQMIEQKLVVVALFNCTRTGNLNTRFGVNERKVRRASGPRRSKPTFRKLRCK